MKLRNKKTGEIESVDYISVARSAFDLYSNEGNKKIASGISPIPLCYESLKEVNEEWEDYKPAEPLIKNKELRRAIREWATITFEWGKYTENKVRVGYEGDDIYCFKIFDCLFEIPLSEKEAIADGEYTITELCGEEEE